MTERIIYLLNLFFLFTLSAFCQNHYLTISTGYVNKGYLNTVGHGYNISAAYSYQHDQLWRFRVQILHSNSYSRNYQPQFTADDIVDAATIMRVTDFPEDGSGQELHPVFLRTDFYLSQDAILQFDASPEFGHDRAVFFISDYPVLDRKSLKFRIGVGTGIGFSNRQERILSFSEDVSNPFFINEFFS